MPHAQPAPVLIASESPGVSSSLNGDDPALIRNCALNKDYYTPHSIDLVGEVYQEEIELFGYDFDNAKLEANRLRYNINR